MKRSVLHRALGRDWLVSLGALTSIATVVAVVAGSLAVGDSVRGTLRRRADARLGSTDFLVEAPRFVREALATEIAQDPRFSERFAAIAPLVAVEGWASSNGRAQHVNVYGVDDRFWQFHQVPGRPMPAGQMVVSAALARTFGVSESQTLEVRFRVPSAVPIEALYGAAGNIGRTATLRVASVVQDEPLIEFSPRPRQEDVPAMFVPLGWLQTTLGVERRVNALLVAAQPATPGTVGQMEVLLEDHAALADVGLTLRALSARHAFALEADAGRLSPEHVRSVEEALDSTLIESAPVITTLASEMRVGARTVAYPFVTATNLQLVTPGVAIDTAADVPPIVLNDQTASDLGARRGDSLALDHVTWDETGRAAMQTTRFRVAGIVPIRPNDRDYAPAIPAAADVQDLARWGLPFQLDGTRITPRAAAYWRQYQSTPRAFVPFAVGERLWADRHGVLTSMLMKALPGRDLTQTVQAFDERLRSKIDSAANGLAVTDVRTMVRSASHGMVDIGPRVLGAAVLIVAAAFGLAVLCLQWTVQRRGLEIGVFRAAGMDIGTLRALLASGWRIPLAGAALAGLCSAPLVAWIVVKALTRSWSDLVGTTDLSLHVSVRSLVAGLAAGVVSAVAATWWALPSRQRTVMPVAEARALLSGGPRLPADAARGASRDGFATLCVVALVAFLIVALAAADSRDVNEASAEGVQSGTGGYELMVDTFLPLAPDPQSAGGAEALVRGSRPDVVIDHFRLRPGDDVSRQSVYAPQRPRILGVSPRFAKARRFAFRGSLAATDEERANPWLLLERTSADRVIPVVADSESMEATLGRRVGEEIVLPIGGQRVRLRIVGALEPGSIFQRELLMSEANFRALFPDRDGYQRFLVDAPAAVVPGLRAEIETVWGDRGVAVSSARDVLDALAAGAIAQRSMFRMFSRIGLAIAGLALAVATLRRGARLSALGQRERSASQRIPLLAALLGPICLGLAVGAAVVFMVVFPSLTPAGRISLVTAMAGHAAVLLASAVAAILAAPLPLRPARRPSGGMTS